jgi:hypothetical protein
MLRQNISVPAGNRPLEDDLIDGWKKTQLPMAFEALADFQYDMGQNTSFARQREYWNASYEKSAKLVAYYPEDKDRAERFAQMRAGAVKQQYAVDDAAANQRARERAANPPADSGMPASNPRQDRLRAECAAIARENASHKNDIYWDGTTPPKCLFM